MQIYIKTNINEDVLTCTDIHRQAEIQTDGRTADRHTDRCTDRQMFPYTYLQYIRLTYTDRQDR